MTIPTMPFGGLMQTERLPYFTLYDTQEPISAPLFTRFIVPVPVGWSSSLLHVKGPVNQLG
jgi:hypothetical protein